MTTSFYAALLTLFYVFLSLRTIMARNKHKVSLGDAGPGELQRAIRVHGNFAEYAPLALILLFLIEFTGGPRLLLHGLGTLFVLARCLHAHGVSQVKEVFVFRQVGMVGTFGVLLVAAGYLLVRFLSHSL